MAKLLTFIKHFTIALLIMTCLVACSRVNQRNFDKIKNDMSLRDVTSILGNPTSAESINVAGISGTSAVWKTDKVEIDIQFLNDKVTVKSFSKITPETFTKND